MDNLINLMSTLYQKNNTPPPQQQNIPKEILDQYPYGEFPIRYTKVGQEDIRKNSENRFAYTIEPTQIDNQNNSNNLDFKTLLPLIQTLSNKNTSSKDMFKVFSQLLFKDNPELQSLLELFSKTTTPSIKNQEIDNRELFPNTNKVSISSLQKIKNT